MKKIWTYDRESGVLLGEGQADADPMHAGKWLLPAFSTERVPPKAGVGESAVMKDGVWTLVPDWRGVMLFGPGEIASPACLITEIGKRPADIGATDTLPPAPVAGVHEIPFVVDGQWVMKPDWRGVALWNCQTKAPELIKEPGMLPSDMGFTDQPPPHYPASFDGERWAPLLERMREETWAVIKAERDRRMQDGGCVAGSQWFRSDAFSRAQYIGLIALGKNVPAGLEWKTMNREKVPMTDDLAQEILGAAVLSDTLIHAAAEAHHAALQACETPWTYDLKAGWPTSFTG